MAAARPVFEGQAARASLGPAGIGALGSVGRRRAGAAHSGRHARSWVNRLPAVLGTNGHYIAHDPGNLAVALVIFGAKANLRAPGGAIHEAAAGGRSRTAIHHS